jgi:hypothetical protein
MTLPAAQQRALDGMAEAMRASEPRLVSMFAMFTRLTGNEVAPGREQLPRRPMRFPCFGVPSALPAARVRLCGGARCCWFS